LNLEPGVRLIFIVSAGVLCPERLKKTASAISLNDSVQSHLLHAAYFLRS